MNRKPDQELRRGWTTGACATAATKAAVLAFFGEEFPAKVQINLPRGETPEFAVAMTASGENWAEAGVVKDAGDDPDVTHGALIKVKIGRSRGGIVFLAGEGVGTVTRPGLPVAVGEPAINPVPRSMMVEMVEKLAAQFQKTSDLTITISIPGGAKISEKTWNQRLGIVGGLSILGTTGIVRPFSCSAWIASIHRGVDVARAQGQAHVAGCTGATSEKVVQGLYDLPDFAMLDMGDFAGGLIKYINKHPVDRLTLGGGFGKMTKLAQGAMDLHSGRSQVDFTQLSQWAAHLGGDEAAVRCANTAMEAVEIVPALAAEVARRARQVAQGKMPEILVDTLVISRSGEILAKSMPEIDENSIKTTRNLRKL